MQAWLVDLKLERYVDTLTSNGFETLADAALLTVEDLASIGITLGGHVNRIMKNLPGIDGSIAHATPTQPQAPARPPQVAPKPGDSPKVAPKPAPKPGGSPKVAPKPAPKPASPQVAPRPITRAAAPDVAPDRPPKPPAAASTAAQSTAAPPLPEYSNKTTIQAAAAVSARACPLPMPLPPTLLRSV